MTRKAVEDYFRARDIKFRQMCCVEKGRGAWDDLTKIGKEHAPWFCEAHNVYIAFQFARLEPTQSAEAHDSDTLEKITIFHWLEGCM